MRKTRSWSAVFAAAAVLTLSACGGGAQLGDGGTTLGGTTGGDDGGPAVKTLNLLASSPTLTSDASDVSAGVTLTVVARDENNNVVPGVTVVFSTETSAEINVTNPAVTDANGRTTAVLTTGGDPENRVIEVTAAASGLSSSVEITVVGTTLGISGPDSTQINVPTEYTVLLTDASGDGIANVPIEITTDAGNSLTSDSLVTDATGQVTVALTASQAVTTLTARALGLTATKQVNVSTDEFTIDVRLNGNPVAPGPIVAGTNLCSDGSSPPCPPELDIAIKSYRIFVTWRQNNAPVANRAINFAATRGSVTNATQTNASGQASATLTSTQSGFSILTASNSDSDQSRPSINTKVEFVATVPDKIEVQVDPASVPPNQTSEVTAIVRDPDNNLVKNVTVEFSLSDQTAGTLSSPTAVTNSQGLARITYSSSSQASATEGITITGRVRGTTISDDASLTVGGRAADITIGTGSQIVIKDASTYQLPFTVVVTDSAGNPVPDAGFRLTLSPTRYFEGTFGGVAPCPNEDLNRNDILDPGEDANQSGALDPGRVAALPATIELDEDGSGQFLVTYAKTFGQFVEVEITGTAIVAGTETTEKRRFLLQVAEADVPNLPGTSPFGLDLDCSTSIKAETDGGSETPSLPVVSIAAADASITQAEAAGTFGVTVQLNAAAENDVLLPIVAGAGGDTAVADVDYVAPESVLIPAGSLSGSFNVQIVVDGEEEDDELFTLALGEPLTENATLGTNAVARVIILADADLPRVSFAGASRNLTVTEGDMDGTITLTLLLDRASSQNIRVPVNFGDPADTATVNVDYGPSDAAPDAKTDIVQIPAGTTSATLTVRIVGDDVDEANESFTLTLDDPVDSNALLLDRGVSRTSRTVILDDDP